MSSDRGAIGVETVAMTMRFGGFSALEDVGIRIMPGDFHALLGENGAGKSTLVKCIMGFYRPTSGQVMVDDHEHHIGGPRDAHALGLGMVYQHFTLVPSLTGAENLVIARSDTPAVIDWRSEQRALETFMAGMPFRVPLNRRVADLAAGEKQKLEIIKQLYLGRRFLILDEPTSVLTLGEAEEVLGLVRGMTDAGELTVLMITHKFREVRAFASNVTVLRRGRKVGSGPVASLDNRDLAAMMIGEARLTDLGERQPVPGERPPILEVSGLRADDRTGSHQIAIEDLRVKPGEIVGIAGISGNGQKEFLEVLSGQRPKGGGAIRVKGMPFHAKRRESARANVRFIPEEPLRNACAPKMSVAENMAFGIFDHGPSGQSGWPRWLNIRGMRRFAKDLVARFNVKTASLDSPIESLSGGNVQRAVLARELTGQVDLLVVSNPCFGLDFSAVADIRAKIMAARNGGSAVLLFSEDLDELLELSDRILVMSDGQVTYETSIESADPHEIGEHMAGHH